MVLLMPQVIFKVSTFASGRGGGGRDDFLAVVANVKMKAVAGSNSR
jgi:hypothetical protein